MADVELLHPFNRCHRLHVLIGEAVAGIDPQAQAAGNKAAFAQPGQREGLLVPGGLGIGARMQLHPAGAGGLAGLELQLISIHKQAHPHACVLEPADQAGEVVPLAAHIQSPFGGHLLALLGHQGDHVGLDAKGDRFHFGGGRHFQIQAASHRGPQQVHIAILDVAAVFPQVNGDAIGPP